MNKEELLRKELEIGIFNENIGKLIYIFPVNKEKIENAAQNFFKKKAHDSSGEEEKTKNEKMRFLCITSNVNII